MTREELEEQINVICQNIDMNVESWNIGADKIMLLIDNFNTPDLSEMWLDELKSQVLQQSPMLMDYLRRKNWTFEGIENELMLFVEANYPKQDQSHEIVRKHFFNYIKKRKPNTNEQSTVQRLKNF